MKNNIDIKEKVKTKIAISKFKEENTIINKKRKFIRSKIGIVACLVVVLSSVVFAKDIENFVKAQFKNFGLDKGMNRAIENGYIATSDMNLIEQNSNFIGNNTLDNIDTKVKIEKFLMTDSSLSVEFYLEFDRKINDYVNLGKDTINGNIDYEKSDLIELLDLIIIDEENRIVYMSEYVTKENFIEFCKKNNLNYNYEDYYKKFNQIYTIKQIYNNNNSIGVNLVYRATANEFPKSKKLSFYFNTIDIMSKQDISNQTLINGNWEINLDVPETMYNRENIYYKVISCENENFDVYEAKATQTGLEVGIKILNVQKPVYPKELTEIESKNIEKGIKKDLYANRESIIEYYGSETYLELWEDYYKNDMLILPHGYSLSMIPWVEDEANGCYVINSNNEKFETKLSDRVHRGEYIDENTYDFYETFELTKYDATDKLNVIIDYKGKAIKIELEKIK